MGTEQGSPLPERFGDYILTARLGKGGIAEVFRAHQVDDPARSPVAIKRLLRPDQESILRLTEEARFGLELDDAHIVKVISQGRVGNKPFLVMEIVDGVDLSTLFRRLRRRHQAFPTEVIISLLIEMARGLQALHLHKSADSKQDDPIVHGDLKPSNVLLGKDGQIKLTDLGIAHRISEARSGLAQIEAGTLEYMAPERLRPGEDILLTPAVDIFSLGVIAYELCTMRALFSGAPQRMMQQILNAEAFIKLALEQVPDFIHPTLKAVTARMLAATPEGRPANIAEVITQLNQLRERLKLPVDLAHFVAPYTGFDPLEDLTERVTSYQPRPPKGEVVNQQKAAGPITHLKIEQLTDMLKKPVIATADPGMISRQRNERRKRLLTAISASFGLFVLIVLIIYATLPTTIAISSNPLGAMVSIQPECEGPFGSLQPTPLSIHRAGPWPMCLRMSAPGYVTEVLRLDTPSFIQKQMVADLTLQKEVCLEVDSKPIGLAVYVDYSLRGYTSNSTTRVCGLAPATPYVVQLEYRGERWDVEEVQGKAGETIAVFHDFGGSIMAKATPMQRCERYYRGKQYQRAIEICRVAVTQSETYSERIAALIIQARAYQAQKDDITGCDTLHSALGTAVENRDIDLELQVQDWRNKFGCGPQVRLAQTDAAGNPVPASPSADPAAKPSGAAAADKAATPAKDGGAQTQPKADAPTDPAQDSQKATSQEVVR